MRSSMRLKSSVAEGAVNIHVPSGIESSTFFTPVIPETVVSMVPLLHTYQIANVKGIVVTALNVFLETQDENSGINSKISCQRPEELASTMSEDHYAIILSGLYCVIKFAVRLKIRWPVLLEDLKRINFPSDIADLVVKGIQLKRENLETAVVVKRMKHPTIAKLRWRVDVIISNGLLSKVMRPNIVMQMMLSNGYIKTFSVSIEQFNQMRYGVAKMLHTLRRIERHPIIRVVSELEKRDAEERLKIEKSK